MSWLTKLKIVWGSICPEHLAKTYIDPDDYKPRLRCSVTGEPLEGEYLPSEPSVALDSE
jgi:hypothetical protein